jgi:hypothetical protein
MRTTWKWQRAVLVFLALLGMGVCGCALPNLFAWAFAPRHPTKTVKAEYALEAERLVVVPYAGTDTLFNYRSAPIDVSANIINFLLANMKGRVKSIVNPLAVNQWQESNLDWTNMSLEEIAKVFQADTVLYVELEHYTLLEEGSANLYRGHVRGRVQVAKAGAARNPVYETAVEILFPPDHPVGVTGTSEAVIRQNTDAQFASAVAAKFYDRTVEVQGGQE